MRKFWLTLLPLFLFAQAQIVEAQHSISLTWVDPNSTADTYNVKRGPAGGPYTVLASSSVPAYTDSGLSANATYGYVVSAISAGVESANSAEAVAVIPQAPAPPPVPATFPYALGPQSSLAFSWKTGTTAPASQSVLVWDTSPCPPPTGVPTCHWPVTVTVDAPWLVATPASGTTALNAAVSINTAGLSANTYKGNVIFTSAQLKSGVLKIPVTLVVVPGPPPPPPPSVHCASGAQPDCMLSNFVSGSYSVSVTDASGKVIATSTVSRP